MKAELERTNAGPLMLTIQADTEVEGIALERWIDENSGAPLRGLLVIANPNFPAKS